MPLLSVVSNDLGKCQLVADNVCVCVCIMEYFSVIKMRKPYCATAAICIYSKGIIFLFVYVSELRTIQ